MQVRTMIAILTTAVVWCEQFSEIASAPTPSGPSFKPSQRLPGPLDASDQLAIAYLKREAAHEKHHGSGGSASGSGDFLKHIGKSIGQGIKNKISQIAKSSAGASAYFSKSSSGHGHYPPDDHHHVYYSAPHPPPHYHHHHVQEEGHHSKPFDFWTLKKSVLYTLLQAVKAIKGGVIAIKGQLIKGGGHLLTAKGKLIHGGGEALTNIGKNIAASAFMLVPESHDHDEETIHDAPDEHQSDGYVYTAPSGPTLDVPPSAPATFYGPPSGPGHYYHNSVYDGKRSPHDGLIILRKIPQQQQQQQQYAHDSDGDTTNTAGVQAKPQDEDQQHAASNPQPLRPPPLLHHSQQQQQQVIQKPQQLARPQPTPAFRPLSDGIVPKMKHLVTNVFQSSSFPTLFGGDPTKHTTHAHAEAEADAVSSHSAAHAVVVEPQEAHIGSLMNYLDYLKKEEKRRQKIKQQAQPGQPGQQQQVATKVKDVVYVTPAPSASVANSKPSKHEDNVDSQNQQQPTAVALEQQLMQLANLQNGAGPDVLPPPYYLDNGGGEGAGNDGYGPIFVDLPANMDVASLLTQYEAEQHQHPPQIFATPETMLLPAPTASEQLQQLDHQQHTLQLQEQQLQHMYDLPDALTEADSSNSFLISVPDDDAVQGRSLRAGAKVKRHNAPPVTKLRRLPRWQQLQLMQQKLHRPVRTLPSPPPLKKQLDLIRKLAFDVNPDGSIAIQ